tara:strand:+ start:307 stop:801 length:495 start_codon:yes stop_codon:yes gene_type:complete
MIKDDYTKSINPVIGISPIYLILGTIPGQESLKQRQYYAHPRNSFWKIIFKIFNYNFTKSYSEQINFIKENQIALWDVCFTCYRKGSLDSNIKEEIPNKIPKLLENNSTISNIIFNGTTAEKLFKKHFKYLENKKYFTALSTSPANASYSFEQKLKNWKVGFLI